MQGRYNFDTIFTYNSNTDTITTRYSVNINGASFGPGSTINRFSYLGGLNLFNYIGRDIAGQWNDTTRVLNILGFY